MDPFLSGVTFHLRDRGSELVESWRAAFEGCPMVVPRRGAFFTPPADAVVSPANRWLVFAPTMRVLMRVAQPGPPR